MKINKILQLPSNTQVTVSGWVFTTRKQKNLSFITINDGSNTNGIQLIVENNDTKYSIGTSIKVTGILVESPAQEQDKEINVETINIIGPVYDDYPLSKNKISLDTLRNYHHLRTRTKTFRSVFRIKSTIWSATDLFYQKHNYLRLDPNVITINECEGGAGVFSVCEDKQLSWDKEHFNKPVYLTVSSQLHLEALACSLGSVYTMNKSFRSEHSNTNKHLSEFTHLEIEDIFCTLDDLMEHAEEYIKFIIQYVLEVNKDDIKALNGFISKGLIDRLTHILETDFKKIEYREAIKLVNGTYGEDLSSEQENKLTELFNGPVFVTNWASEIKSFYMKENGDGTCSSFDLLMPYGIGELIGGSMREENYDVLMDKIKKNNIDETNLQFYIDLRKYGTVEHGGYGLGLDRLTMLLTGMNNIKDTIPFPVSYQNCNY